MAPISKLPEGCVAKIISLTSPKDACRTAAVSHEFKAASESDTVWERFLPPDYEEKISAAANSTVLAFSSKKELYFLLCEVGLLLDSGRLFFRLSKSSGKKCYMVCAQELRITWGDAPEHWNWFITPESRFGTVAELVKVSWLDIRTTIYSGWLSPNTKYAAHLVYHFNTYPIMLHIPSMAAIRKTTDDEGKVSTVYIFPPYDDEEWSSGRKQIRKSQLPRKRKDGWLEIELGEFFVAEEDIFDIDIAIFEHKDQYWKRGLIVEGIEVSPKSNHFD